MLMRHPDQATAFAQCTWLPLSMLGSSLTDSCVSVSVAGIQHHCEVSEGDVPTPPTSLPTYLDVLLPPQPPCLGPGNRAHNPVERPQQGALQEKGQAAHIHIGSVETPAGGPAGNHRACMHGVHASGRGTAHEASQASTQ
jgi:hypothetical protein